MQYAVIIEREPGAPTIGASSPDVNVYVIKDASVSDDELLAAFKEALDFHLDVLREDGLPIPEPHYRVVAVPA